MRWRSMVGDTAAAAVDEREEVGVGKELAQHLEHLLAAAHAGEPVVDEGDSHGVTRRRPATVS